MNREVETIHELASKWVSLGLDFCESAGGVSKMYIYAASELGVKYANILFEQHGVVIYPDNLKAEGIDHGLIFRMQDLMLEDLDEAERAFRSAGVPCPTEYRVTYELGPRRLDVQLSHEIKYAEHPVKTLEHGPEDWLDGRLEKVFGKLLPPESEWHKVGKKRTY
jgi:hypothetical protein